MTQKSERVSPLGVALVVGALLLTLFVFRDGVVNMVKYWDEPEYSHGYLIPLISLYLLSIRAVLLDRNGATSSWFGVIVTGLGLSGLLLGQLSALYAIVHFSFVITLWGLVLSQVGWRGIKALWPPLLFLLFMVPLPRFIQWNLSSDLQLISSQLGTWILRVLTVPVFLEGNVIDLGSYKMQVVEACAGLRYLFPLMCFGFLYALLLRVRVWQKLFIFLSSVPIGIFMNSFRIAVTGLLVNRFGPSAAEGFLHYFEGWIIFSACLLIMFCEVGVLAWVQKVKIDDILDIQIPNRSSYAGLRILFQPSRPLMAACLMVMAGGVAAFYLAVRPEILPVRESLQSFPLSLAEWRGVPNEIPPAQLEELQATDYLLNTYVNQLDSQGLTLYVAYYESQSTGVAVHSPRACLPGGGWRVETSGERAIQGMLPSGAGLKVNRTVVSRSGQNMLVYYWFMQRGRIVTNEYLVKWFIFLDSLRLSRTDGALVRLTTLVGEAEELASAEARLQGFLKVAYPRLYYFIPQEKVTAQVGR